MLLMQKCRRMNWGCGQHRVSGWINCDRQRGNGIDVSCDILQAGLPLPAQSLDYIVSIHALQEIPLDQQIPVLKELRRVLRPGGVLRLCLPDADRAIDAYIHRRRDHFVVPDEDYCSLGGKFVAHILWYGHSRLMFTADFAEELLHKAGFQRVDHCAYRETASPFEEITELDNRENESLFIEAVR